MDHSYPYIASLTREPFLFYEMRSTAKLMAEGNSDDAIVEEIVEQNLFQYPTEKSITRMAKACIKRLHALEDDSLVSAIASQPTDVAKQICLYALMKQSRLVWEFMLTVIGEKYRLRDTSFGKIDLNTFFMRLQEQNDTVASWSDTTITKLKQIIARVLVETEYLDNRGADHLNGLHGCSFRSGLQGYVPARQGADEAGAGAENHPRLASHSPLDDGQHLHTHRPSRKHQAGQREVYRENRRHRGNDHGT